MHKRIIESVMTLSCLYRDFFPLGTFSRTIAAAFADQYGIIKISPALFE